VDCPWGLKAFSGYLGENKDAWKVGALPHFAHAPEEEQTPSVCAARPDPTYSPQEYDATHLVQSYSGPALDILIDQVCTTLYWDLQSPPEHGQLNPVRPLSPTGL
jgi:hypothetical protein